MLDVRRGSIAARGLSVGWAMLAFACAQPPGAASTAAPTPEAPLAPNNAQPNAPNAVNTPTDTTGTARNTPPAGTSSTTPPVVTPPTAVAPPSSANPPVTPPPMNPGLPVGPKGTAPNGIPLERIVPTDDRAVVNAARSPLPISGGTLLISRDGMQAFASDPDRDRVSVVDLFTHLLVGNVALQAGDEPGRLVQDEQNRLHVVLRNAGAVATIDLWARTVTARRSVCASPRGILYEASSKLLHVSCMGGEIVSLPAAGGEVSARAKVDSDLRDLVTQGEGLYVTRAKSAELIKLDANKVAVSRVRPLEPRFLFPETTGAQVVDTLEPTLARRTVASKDGGFVMLHQGSRNGDIELGGMHDGSTQVTGASPYGGTGTCRGVVNTEITKFDREGKATVTAQLSDVLAVDVAEGPDGEIAVAVAGARDPLQPAVGFNGDAFAGAKLPIAPAGSFPGDGIFSVSRYHAATLQAFAEQSQMGGCAPPMAIHPLEGPATSVAFLSDGRLIAQTREPAALWVLGALSDPNQAAPAKISLGGVSVFDTGHELFHRDAGAGVACASCHLEGGDDGHTWHFVDQGPRRTQSIQVGLEGTQPFHWVGDMSDIGTLMENVFVGRMGGVHQTPARVGALEKWMYSVKAPVPLRVPTDAAAVRGQAIFAGEAECSKCHEGAKFTNNKTVDVGTGLPLQVPSLVAIGYRGPWLHNGCAATLLDRFNPACGGGDQHGRTLQLSTDQLQDLVAYLETL